MQETQEFIAKGYKLPSKSEQFMKLKNGQNKFRILSPATCGYVVFDPLKKPHRRLEEEGAFSEQELNELGTEDKCKHFMYFLVWNYQEGKVQVLELTQQSLKKPLLDYIENEEYGNPLNYDVSIKKEGESLTTQYSLIASPPKPRAEIITEELAKIKYNQFAIIDGNCPLD